MKTEVVLVPGLWMPAAAMLPLAARLSRRGYAPRLYGYRGRASFDTNVERFAGYVRENLGGRPAHFIGHSLGGVLVLDALNRHPDIRVASALLLGAPARGCMAGRRFGRHRFGRWMMGACNARWVEHDAAWQRSEPLGVVAGTRAFGLGAAFVPLPDENDGVVRVEETAVRGMTAQAVLPQAHSLMLTSGRTGRLVERFLAAGRFE